MAVASDIKPAPPRPNPAPSWDQSCPLLALLYSFAAPIPPLSLDTCHGISVLCYSSVLYGTFATAQAGRACALPELGKYRILPLNF